MALRLRPEPMSDADDDEIRDDAVLPEPSDLITDDDGSSDEPIEEDDEDEGLWRSLPGPLIAGLTFVPTFLAVFFGLTYLLGNVLAITPTASTSAPATAKADVGRQATPPRPEALRDQLAMPRLFDPSSTGSPLPGSPSTASPFPGSPGTDSKGSDPSAGIRPSEPREAPRAPSGENATPPAVERATPPAAPTLPPMARSPIPEPRAARSAEPAREPRAAVLNTTPERTPAVESGKSREWTPAAAFADREAAGRLASSIQQQGYPVEIRQEQSSSRPWVVWIGAKPSGGARRR
jgi:hypothetical protein